MVNTSVFVLDSNVQCVLLKTIGSNLECDLAVISHRSSDLDRLRFYSMYTCLFDSYCFSHHIDSMWLKSVEQF